MRQKNKIPQMKKVMHIDLCMTFFIRLYGILSASHRIESGIGG